MVQGSAAGHLARESCQNGKETQCLRLNLKRVAISVCILGQQHENAVDDCA